ncbi:MAG: carboxypeptidase-like regulatory domain-containing protein, partial [Syntrophothermus sp.]
MKKFFTLCLLIIVVPFYAFSQKYSVSGIVKDDATGETIIGATILYAEGKGVVTGVDGSYFFKADPGTYTIKVSYVGYTGEEKKVTVSNSNVTVNFSLKTTVLSEVEVVADVAKA